MGWLPVSRSAKEQEGVPEKEVDGFGFGAGTVLFACVGCARLFFVAGGSAGLREGLGRQVG